MNKYLVILDLPTGMAQLSNVAIILADSYNEAKDKFIKYQSLSVDTKLDLYVYELDKIAPDWYYFT